jgi:hypothetical protein
MGHEVKTGKHATKLIQESVKFVSLENGGMHTLDFYPYSSLLHAAMLFRESVVFTSIVKHTRQSLGEGYGFNYRVITEQFAGFVPDKVSSKKKNGIK